MGLVWGPLGPFLVEFEGLLPEGPPINPATHSGLGCRSEKVGGWEAASSLVELLRARSLCFVRDLSGPWYGPS